MIQPIEFFDKLSEEIYNYCNKVNEELGIKKTIDNLLGYIKVFVFFENFIHFYRK